MPRYVHLTVPKGFRANAPGVVLRRAYVPDRDVERREGFSVTTPVRSILDLAASKVEIDQLARVVQDAIDRGITTRRALRERADEFGAVAALAIERALLQESA
jgi:hypothetical protein